MFRCVDFCCICFNNEENLQLLDSTDSDNITYYNKLTSSVPEMCFNEMNEQMLVCEKCCETIKTVYKFRQKCLKIKSKPINYSSFAALSEDPDQMIEWCMNAGLISKVYECPECGVNMKLVSRSSAIDKKQWRCINGGHDVRRSVRKSSWFSQSKLSVYQILKIAHLWIMKASNDSIISELKLARGTVVDWKNFCREICVDAIVDENEMIGGEGIIVDLDESKFGKRKCQRDRFVKGKWVFGGIERGTNKCFMVVLAEKSMDMLLNVIKANIRMGSIIISDCWRAYNCIKIEGYHFRDPDTGVSANNIEGTWPAVKKQSRKCEDGFNNYLFENMWRQRHKDESLFQVFMTAVVKQYPPNIRDN